MKSKKESRESSTYHTLTVSHIDENTHTLCHLTDVTNIYTKQATTTTTQRKKKNKKINEPEVQEPVYLHFLKRVYTSRLYSTTYTKANVSYVWIVW